MSTALALDAPRRPRLDLWGGYAVLAALLAPVLVPPGPGRTAWLDPLNLVALAAFGGWLAITRRSVVVPFVGPLILMSMGSLIACANAANPGAAFLTVIQDAYLFVWFVMLVNVLRGRGDLRGVRYAWMFAGCAVALIGLVGVVQHGGSLGEITNSRGFRAMGTFDQPDELADYLAMSVLVSMSLTGRLARLLSAGAILIMLLAMAATKANGGLIALATGLAAWAVVRAWAAGFTPIGWLGLALVGVGAVLVAAWLVLGLGVGGAALGKLEAHSFLGRMGHSSEGREMIWKALIRRYEKSPLGLGPGNSRWQHLRIEERERPVAGHLDTYDSGADPFLSKESHNDYFAYLVERGPIALLGMLLMRWQAFGRILRGGGFGRGTQRGKERAAAGVLTAALFGAWVASCLNSNTIETLHFRHVWLFLAMVCAIDAARADERAAGAALEPQRAMIAGRAA